MFKKLTDFSYKRNWKEAIGFYLAYLLLAVILGGVFGALLSTSTNAQTFQEGFNAGLQSNVGPMVAIIYIAIISVLLLIKRKLYTKFRYLILIVINLILAILGGGLLGLIIPAFMTTREVSAN